MTNPNAPPRSLWAPPERAVRRMDKDRPRPSATLMTDAPRALWVSEYSPRPRFHEALMAYILDDWGVAIPEYDSLEWRIYRLSVAQPGEGVEAWQYPILNLEDILDFWATHRDQFWMIPTPLGIFCFPWEETVENECSLSLY